MKLNKNADNARFYEAAKELQSIAHQLGYNEFKEAVLYALHSASDDTADFDDKTLTQQYNYLANVVSDAIDNEPEFDGNGIGE